MLPSQDTTIHGLLREGAANWPDRLLVQLHDGDRWTWAQALREGARAANALAARGVQRNDRVMMPLPNGPTWLRAWWGATLLGAVVVPVNPMLRGRTLADICERVSPAAVVAEDKMAALLPAAVLPLRVTPDELTAGAEGIPELDPLPAPWDTHCLLMTSGTTGPSKASVTTHAYAATLVAFIVERCGVGPDDVFQADMPWFHLSSFAPAIQMMRVGGTIMLRSAPAMTSYWQTAKDLGSTFAIAPGTVAAFLASQPGSPADRDHSLRFMLCSPLPPDPDGYVQRFGLSGLVTAYGSTEANLVTTTTLDEPYRAGSCGTARPGFEIRIVDEHDLPVPRGEVGELVVRADRPWLQTQGYFERPEATVRLLRNGWVHTGDALRIDEDGYFFFHDRYKDALRRRGENISSFEVERDVATHPGVAEVACVAHPSEVSGDDEVKVFIVAAEGATIDFPELLAHLVERMAHYTVPRYYELIDALPKTPTQRVQKHLLRAKGDSVHTWDREAAGYHVTRTGLLVSAGS
jgi:crotonobetaine/carnitine-CoA ligase